MGGGKEEVAAVRSEKKKTVLFLILLFVFYIFPNQSIPIHGEESAQILVDLTSSPADPATDSRISLIQAAQTVNGEYQLLAPFNTGKADFLQNWSEEITAEQREAYAEQLQKLTLEAINKNQPVVRIEPSIQTDRQIGYSDLQPGLYLLTSAQGNMYSLYPPVIVEIKSGSESPIRIFPKVQYPAVSVIKKDERGHTITGLDFEFRIYANPECTVELAVLKGNPRTGKTDFYTLTSSTPVYLREVKAPKDYRLSEAVIPIHFDGNQVFINGTEPLSSTSSPYEFEIPVVNEKNDFDISTDEDSSDSSSDSSSSSSSSDDSSKSSGSSDSSSDSHKLTSTSNSNSSHDPSHRGNGPNTAAEMGIRYLLMFFSVAILGLIGLTDITKADKRKR